MKRWLKAMAAVLALAAAMPAAQAVRASATMEIGFRIVEACTVRSSQASDQDFDVRCQYRTPYRIQAGSDSTAAGAPRRTERPLDHDAPAALTVWF